jgi:hypothetical protein
MVVWDTTAGGEPRVLAGIGGRVKDLAFSPDSRRLATLAVGAAGRVEIKVWDPASGQELLTLPEPEQAAFIRFSADGHKLYVFDYEGRKAHDASPLPPVLEAPDVLPRTYELIKPDATREEFAAQLDQFALSPALKAKALEL